MFEESLVSSRLQKEPRRRKTFASVAFLVHAVFFLAMLFFQYWNVDALPEPPVRFAFFTAMQAPPPPPPVRLIAPKPAEPAAAQPPAAQPPAQPMPEPMAAAPFPVQPTDVPAAAPERNDGPAGGPSAGSGPVGIPGDGPGTGGGSEVGLDKVLTVGGAVTRPVGIFQPQPRYTETARKVRLQGAVILEAIIDREGRVSDLRMIKGLGLGLTDEAVKTVKQWKFEPATLNGQPVAVYYTLTIYFRLQ